MSEHGTESPRRSPQQQQAALLLLLKLYFCPTLDKLLTDRVES